MDVALPWLVTRQTSALTDASLNMDIQSDHSLKDCAIKTGDRRSLIPRKHSVYMSELASEKAGVCMRRARLSVPTWHRCHDVSGQTILCRRNNVVAKRE